LAHFLRERLHDVDLTHTIGDHEYAELMVDSLGLIPL
jgi:hypothetical protein